MLTRPFLERTKPRLLDGRSRANKKTSIPATLEPPLLLSSSVLYTRTVARIAITKKKKVAWEKWKRVTSN